MRTRHPGGGDRGGAFALDGFVRLPLEHAAQHRIAPPHRQVPGRARQPDEFTGASVRTGQPNTRSCALESSGRCGKETRYGAKRPSVSLAHVVEHERGRVFDVYGSPASSLELDEIAALLDLRTMGLPTSRR